MTNFNYPDGVAVARLVYFAFALIGSIIVVWRHGFGKNSGWIFLTIFCIIRIIGSSAELATISSTNSTAATVAAVTSALGLSPLLLASLGIISRIYYSILKAPWNFFFSFVILRVVQTPAAVGLILCIVGVTSADNLEDIVDQVTLKIGVALFLAVYIALVLLTIGAAIASRRTGRGERKLLIAVKLSLPVLLIRVVYSMLGAFSHLSTFNPITGSTTADLCMATIEEMLVVLIYIWAGLVVNSVPDDVQKKRTPQSRLLYRIGRGDFGSEKLGILSMGAAAIGEAWNHAKNERDDEPDIERAVHSTS